MQSIVYPLNIGTLATWLSVAGFGAVGAIVNKPTQNLDPPPKASETIWSEPEITLATEPASSTAVADSPPPEATPTAPGPLPDPPAMPETTELPPLPDVPDPPVATPPTRPPTRPAATAATRPTRTARPAAQGSAPNSANTGTGTGPVLTTSARLAGGLMPAPSYPAEARRLGQTGTLVVEFTIDTTGRVISAYAKSPSPWPLLNDEAVRTVRRWKFPPGPVMKLQRPIVFQLR